MPNVGRFRRQASSSSKSSTPRLSRLPAVRRSSATEARSRVAHRTPTASNSAQRHQPVARRTPHVPETPHRSQPTSTRHRPPSPDPPETVVHGRRRAEWRWTGRVVTAVRRQCLHLQDRRRTIICRRHRRHHPAFYCRQPDPRVWPPPPCGTRPIRRTSSAATALDITDTTLDPRAAVSPVATATW